MENADKVKYGTLLSGLQTQISLSNNQYPKTLLEANNVLSNFKADNQIRQKFTNSKKETMIENAAVVAKVVINLQHASVKTNLNQSGQSTSPRTNNNPILTQNQEKNCNQQIHNHRLLDLHQLLQVLFQVGEESICNFFNLTI
jgi:hypothetical protein